MPSLPPMMDQRRRLLDERYTRAVTILRARRTLTSTLSTDLLTAGDVPLSRSIAGWLCMFAPSWHGADECQVLGGQVVGAAAGDKMGGPAAILGGHRSGPARTPPWKLASRRRLGMIP